MVVSKWVLGDPFNKKTTYWRKWCVYTVPVQILSVELPAVAGFWNRKYLEAPQWPELRLCYANTRYKDTMRHRLIFMKQNS